MQKLVIYWCRRDFRLNDNPALFEATKYSTANQLPFLPVFCLDESILQTPNLGQIRFQYLAILLANFSKNFTNFTIFKQDPTILFDKLSHNFELILFTNEDIEPYALKRDAQIKAIIEKNQGKMNIFGDQLTVDKNIKSGTGNIYSVFTPFKNAVWSQFLQAAVYAKPQLSSNFNFLDKQILTSFGLNIISNDLLIIQEQLKKTENILSITLHTSSIYTVDLLSLNIAPVLTSWYKNEDEAIASFDDFLESGKLNNYNQNRDNLALDTDNNGQTSRMSVALKWGLVSTRFLKQKILDFCQVSFLESSTTQENKGVVQYLNELIWREFYKYILYHNPLVLEQEFQTKFRHKIDWVEDETGIIRFLSWIKGQTGYPLVDACMNQIAQIGWMHNRARMLVASVLTKNLGVDWRWGQEYFRAVLLDLDEASNNGGWQWAASVGSDPKPIRIFNPYLQAQNHDKDLKYQSQWLPKNYLQQFNAHSFFDSDNLADIKAIVEHKEARGEALKRYGLDKTKPVRDF